MRPEGIGTVWVGKNLDTGYLHGPRFYDPKKLTRIWIRGKTASETRYVMGLTKTGKTVIQSIIRPILPTEAKTIKRVATWDGQQYIFPMRIHPFVTINHKRYLIYAFAFSKPVINHIKRIWLRHTKYNCRILVGKLDGTKVYRLYRSAQPKEGNHGITKT